MEDIVDAGGIDAEKLAADAEGYIITQAHATAFSLVAGWR
jgi:hypothetical protein